MLETIAAEVKDKPQWLFVAVAVVAVLAYMSSRNNTTVIDATYAGGGAARGIDPNAAAIEEAAIGAGQANVNTLAALIGAENSNQSSLAGSLAQTGAARDTSLAQTEASRSTSLAQTAAALQASLAQISAYQETADAQTAAGVTISAGNNAASVSAATINAQAAATIAQVNAATEAARIKAQNDAQNNANQTAKDIARAQDNTNIVDNVLHLGAEALAFFGL